MKEWYPGSLTECFVKTFWLPGLMRHYSAFPLKCWGHALSIYIYISIFYIYIYIELKHNKSLIDLIFNFVWQATSITSQGRLLWTFLFSLFRLWNGLNMSINRPFLRIFYLPKKRKVLLDSCDPLLLLLQTVILFFTV